MPSQQTIRVHAELPLGSVEILRQLAQRQNVELDEALRRAVATEGLIQSRVASGSRVWLLAPDGGMSDRRFRR